MHEILSIVIPTYNRQEQLKNQLLSVLSQDLSIVKEIIIIDNNSSYDIVSLIGSFENEKIKLYRNALNLKMPVNLANVFLYSTGDWLWTLSDDDETLPLSIEIIRKTICECDSKVGFIKFAIDREGITQRNAIVNTLEDFIDYYYNEKSVRSGDIIFLSTNLYNKRIIDSKYFSYAFEYSYTYIAQIIPIFFLLNDGKIQARFSTDAIVKYIPPRGDKYTVTAVGKGLSTLSHLPLSLSDTYWKRFLKVSMSITYIGQIISCLKSESKSSVNDFRIIYNNIYRYYLPLHTRAFIKLFFLLMSNSYSRAFVKSTWALLKKFK